MNIGKAFNYPFEDDQWFSKSLIGAIVNAIPIVNFAFLGYMIDLLQNVINGEAEPMPEWGDFGEKWVTGLMVFLASIVYAIPVIVLMCLGFAFGIGTAALAEGGNAADIIGGLFVGVGGLFACLIVLYGLVLSFYYPAIYVNYSRDNTFGAFFEFSKINKIISADVGKYLTAWGVSILAAIVVGFIGAALYAILGIIPCIGWILAWLASAILGVYVFFISGHLFGQVAAVPVTDTAMTVPPPMGEELDTTAPQEDALDTPEEEAPDTPEEPEE